MAQRLAGLVSSQIALDRMKLGRYSFLINPGVFS
jgi:hypothetical protein